MKKYDLQEGDESLKRVLLMMKYDNKKTLSENVEVIIENKAIRNKGQGIDRLFTSLNNLNPKKLSKLPTWSNGKSIISLGTQNIQNIQIKTNIGNLYFFTFKPGGYFTDNNFVLKVKNGVATIGTWDLDRMYFKNEGDKNISDKGFNNTINISDLTIGNEEPPKKEEEKHDTTKKPIQSNEPKIPNELKDSEGVKKFQDWLDQNKQGWATGYTDGLLNKRGKGYGRFGPRTQKAWNQFKVDYLRQISTDGGDTQQTKSDEYKQKLAQMQKDSESLKQPLNKFSDNNTTQTTQSEPTSSPTLDDLFN